MSRRDDLLSETPTDRLYQAAYFCAYRVMRMYWGLRRPLTNGALVAIWSRGEVLLVRNSYVPYYSAPGGYVRPNETGLQAALRELAEEVGVETRADQLSLALDLTHEWEGRRDHVQIFNLTLQHRPIVRVDKREVVSAGWFDPERVRSLEVFPPLKQVIESHGSALLNAG